MKRENPWQLNIHDAKAAMRREILNVWLRALLAWVCLLLAMLGGLIGPELRIEVDSLAVLTASGGIFLLAPAFFIGMRRWLVLDAANIWRQPEVVVAAVLRGSMQTARLFNIKKGRTFSPRRYWLGVWEMYWRARLLASDTVIKTMTLADVPKSLVGLEGVTEVVGASEVDGSMHRPRRRYEIIVLSVVIVAFSVAFLAIAVRL